jgi:LacI family transcriptional regulator
MRDVAALAGVSSSTVSFVVNGREDQRIADGTRQRVLAAVAELHYRPNQTARAFRMGRTHTIGMLTDEIASSPFAGRLILGAQETAWRGDSVLFLVNTGQPGSFNPTAVDSLLDRRVDGLIFAAVSADKVALPPVPAYVPTVLVNCFTDVKQQRATIMPRDVYGGQLAAQALLDAGHRRIVFLAGHYTAWATRMRVRGFQRALRLAGLPFDRDMVIYSGYEPHCGYDGLKQIMARRRRPSGLVCANDRVAMGVLFAAHELGIAVPQDLSLVGYDDQEDLADKVYPALTTVTLPHFDLGVAGVKALTAIRQRQPLTRHHWVEGRLVMRDSVAPFSSSKRAAKTSA